MCEKQGRIRVISADGELQRDPWLDIIDLVNAGVDRGIMSLAFDPQFQTNGLVHSSCCLLTIYSYVYIIYAEDPVPGEPDEPAEQPTQGVIARYTEVNGKGDRNSEKKLVGDTRGSGFPECSTSHHVGDLRFGFDGTLFASAGEGSHWEWVDNGTDRTE